MSCARRFSPPELAWPADLAAQVLSLSATQLPPAPWQLSPGRVVLDNERFLAWLKYDARLGPRSPRAYYGALQRDLELVAAVCLKTCPFKSEPRHD